MKYRLPSKLIIVVAISLLALAAMACGSDDEEEGATVPPGVVSPKPAGATQVDVTLAEWSVLPSTRSIEAGETYFLVQNAGPVDPHELVVIRTDLAPNALPVVDGKVDESQVEVIGEVEEFAPGTSVSGVFNLTPGSYVLICNIAEIEEGELESHYQEGMTVAFTVR